MIHGRYAAGGYYSSANKMINIDRVSFVQNVSGQAVINQSREYLVGLSRQLMRDNPIYRGILGRCVSYVVGNGFGLQARTDSPDWNEAAERLWHEYWQSPVITGAMSGARLESLTFLELLTTGDAFLAFARSNGRDYLQVFEAEQCLTYKDGSSDGIQFDAMGRATSYWFAPYSESGYIDRGAAVKFDAGNVVHLFDHERPSATRGVPVLQSSFPMLHRISDICDAEAIARQMLAHLCISITRENSAEEAYAVSELDNNSDTFRIQEMDYATIFNAAPGESIQAINRNIPGSDFEKSMVVFLRVLGLPLGMPLELVMLDWTKSNYSQSRAVLQQAFQTFSSWQQLIKDRALSRIYRRKIAEWIVNNELPPNAQAARHEWVAPSFPWIDEAAELDAQGRKIELALTTHAEVCKSLQHERADVVNARELEIRDAIARAQSIKADTGEAVPWQLLAGVPSSLTAQAEAVAAEAVEISETQEEIE
jgi:lambda family phage portal protein